MRKLITLLCFISCFYATSLAAQCEFELVTTSAECTPGGNGWFFNFQVQAFNPAPNTGWTAQELGINTQQPFNTPVQIGPFFDLQRVEVMPEFNFPTSCEGQFAFMDPPGCFSGGDSLCAVSIELIEANCGIIAPGFTLTADISGANSTATGWFAPDFGYPQIQQFGVYEFGPFENPVENIVIFSVGSAGCTVASTLTVANPCNNCPLALVPENVFNPSCNQEDGIIEFSVENTQGAIQISYQGENGQSGSVADVTTVSGLGAGCYVFELSDETDFCTATTSICLQNETNISILTDQTQLDCNQTTVVATVTGGSPPYAYDWSNGVTTAVVDNLANGVYQLTVTDAIGCSETVTVFVNSQTVIIQTDSIAVTNASCEQNDGAIAPQVISGFPPFSYLWSNGATTQQITGLAAGVYSLTVTDSNGCSAFGTYQVETDQTINVNIISDGPFPAICEPGQTLDLIAEINGSTDVSGYQLEWSNEAGVVVGTDAVLLVAEPGLYTLSAALVNGENCGGFAQILVFDGQGQNGEVTIQLFAQDSLTGTCEVFLYASYNGINFQADWSVPGGETVTGFSVLASAYGPGTYTVTLYTPTGACPLTGSIQVQPEDLSCVNLSGMVFLDENDDCLNSATEVGLSGQLVQLTNTDDLGRVYFSYTDANGNWSTVIPAGTYDVIAIAQNELFEACPPQTITVTEDNAPAPVMLGIKPLGNCPRVTVDLNIPRIRRCFDSPVYIYYENTGTAISENTVITVEFDEWIDEVSPFFNPLPSSIAPNPNSGGVTATWNLGDLAPFASGTLSLLAYTCNGDAPITSAACVSATVLPNSPCPPADSDWTGASVSVEGECDGDNVVFTLRNSGTGDMSIGLQYVVVEDGVIIMPNEEDSPLVAGGEVEVTLPANGSTYHLRATQEPLHPGLLMPIDFVEGCGMGNTSTGFALQFPVSDDAYWIDEDCQEIIGAYDPNDKLAEPKGYADENYIVADQAIDYQIRFQNTGNDTAFTVVVRDTISELLDLSTFQLLSTTHDVKVTIDSSNAIAFTFDNIMLPDSFVNEPASNGAISFRILPVADLAPGTPIENTAHIYFDFNEAIVTNTYRHTIEEDFVAVSVFDFNPIIERLTIYPNPTAGPARIQLPEALEGESLELDVMDVLGRVMQHYQYTNGERPDANLSPLPAGWYTLRLTSGNTTVGTGRVLLEN